MCTFRNVPHSYIDNNRCMHNRSLHKHAVLARRCVREAVSATHSTPNRMHDGDNWNDVRTHPRTSKDKRHGATGYAFTIEVTNAAGQYTHSRMSSDNQMYEAITCICACPETTRCTTQGMHSCAFQRQPDVRGRACIRERVHTGLRRRRCLVSDIRWCRRAFAPRFGRDIRMYLPSQGL